MSAAVPKVRWAELLPDGFRARRDACAIVYLPLGLCEPHGHVAALGLDLLKAEYYCEESARRFGGIVAPAQGYHIHECGFHAPWLAEVVGNENPLMAAIPPHVMLHLFLYQLRAFAHAGFKAVIAVSGHSGGSQEDLRRASSAFETLSGLRIVMKTDPEWVQGTYEGDHAGSYELSQLMAIRPDLVDLSLLDRRHQPGSGGRMALGDDATSATPERGRAINEAILGAIGTQVSEMRNEFSNGCSVVAPDYADVESLWRELERTMPDWRSCSQKPEQAPVPDSSRWARYVRPLGIFPERG